MPTKKRGGEGMRSGRLRQFAFICLALVLFTASFPLFYANASEYDPEKPENLQAGNLRADSAIVMEAETGNVLFEKNADELRYPASNTKILTVLLALLMSDPDEMVTVSAYATSLPEDASKIGLQAGEQLPMGNLIKATMVASGNDGAIAIAEHISGSEESFVALMNEAAARYGCTRTNFINPHGYHADYHMTTARDLAIITREAMQQPAFRDLAKMTSYTLPATNLAADRRLTSQSQALLEQSEKNDYYYPYATGVKTGFHSLAGYCYVGSAEKEGISLISVILKSGSTARWTDTKKLFEYGFTQFVSTSVTQIYNENRKVINLSGFSLEDKQLGNLELYLRKQNPAADDSLVAPKGKTDEQLKLYHARTQIEFTRTLEAPVESGEVIGIMTYTPVGDTEPVLYDLIASRSVLRRASLAPTVEEITAYTEADPNPFPRFSIEFLVITLLPVILLVGVLILLFKLLTRKRKPKVKQKLTYKTRYYR